MAQSFDDFAEDYDEDIYPLNEEEFVLPTVAMLERLAPGKDVLEMAVGTGRIAIPLAERGYHVTGVDNAPRMLEVLRIKRGGEKIETVAADMSQVRLEKEFDLAYLIFNGITYLLTLEEQAACFKNASLHLRSGGIFVVETFIPRVDQIVKDETAFYAVEENYLGFDKYDRINQLLTSYQYAMNGEKVNTFQSKHRYVWPSELELMGQLAGVELLEKWGSWEGDALTGEADNCIMVWRKP